MGGGPDLEAIVAEIAGRMAAAERGKLADYIPELAQVDARRCGLAVVPVEGEPAVAGDADEPFSIQAFEELARATGWSVFGAL